MRNGSGDAVVLSFFSLPFFPRKNAKMNTSVRTHRDGKGREVGYRN